MKISNFFRGIRKNVIVLGVASFFTDISSEMLYPIIPIFLTSVLGAPMSVVGLIEGIAESTASVLKAFSGWLSDRTGRRRPFVVSGYTLSSFAKPLLYFAYAWPAVLLSRFLDRLGKGLRTSPRDAMIADSTDASFRGKAFGLHRALDTFGAILGPLLAIYFLTVLKEDLRIVFLIAFVPAGLAVLTLIFFLKETPVLRDAKNGIKKIDLKVFGPDFKRFLFASAIFALGNSSDAFLVVRSKQLGLSLILVILAYVLYNITYAAFSTPFGILSDRWPRKNVMIIGYIVFAAVYAAFGFAKGPNMVWILFFIYGFYMAMTDGVGKALVSDMVAKERVATALGLYHFVLGTFAFFASLVAGLLWVKIGVAAPFIYGAIMAAASSVILFTLIRGRPPERTRM